MPDSVLMQMLTVIWETIARMWWFFLLSIFLVGLIKGYKLDRHISAWVNRAGVGGVLIAVFVGMVSPLCACGILPIAISLAMVGTPLAPLIALLVTSPTMGPDALLLTYRGLGTEMAVLKVVGAGVLGISAGLVVLWLERGGVLAGDLVRLRPVYREDGTLAGAYEIGQANNVPVKTMTVVPRESRARFIFDRTLDAGIFIGKFLLLAIVLEAVIVTLVPMQWITSLAGQKSFSSVLVAAVAGFPLPTNQIPIIPILAGLLERGMDRGAAFTLMMAGPVSSIPAILALWGMFRPRVVFSFLAVSLTGSVLLGWGYQLLS